MQQLGIPAINGLIIGIIAIVAGIVIIIFPHILNYLIGIFMIASGAIWIAGGGFIPGAVSIILGIIILVFPHIISSLVGIYLI